MESYRITLQFQAANDEEAMAAGKKQASAFAGSRFVSAELQRGYYWEPIWVDDSVAPDPGAPAQIAAG